MILQYHLHQSNNMTLRGGGMGGGGDKGGEGGGGSGLFQFSLPPTKNTVSVFLDPQWEFC